MTPKDAQDAIGEQDETDFILAPSTHAEKLPASAQALAVLLKDPQLSVLAEQYERHDGAANAARDEYKATLTRANGAVLAATTLSALMMAAQILAGAFLQYGDQLRGVAAVAGVLAGLAATLGARWLFRAREGRLLERWLGCRAKAETERGAYFSTIAEGPDEAPLRLLKLEYFRRYQVDVQRNYYAVASARHAKAAQRTLRIGAFAVALSSIPAFFGAFSAGEGAWSALATLSVIGGAIAAYTAAHEAMTQDRRNAERYEHALETLEMLAAKLGQVRKAVAEGSAEALKVYVTAVNEQLTVEHRQWLESAQGAKKAEDTIDASLGKLDKRAEQNG
jgi:dsDNA-binding SOS-regulon protein